MTSDPRTGLFWIPVAGPGRLAVAARPRGGDWLDDEIRGWERAGVTIVVSLLEPAEVAELDLAGEEAACADCGIEFVSFPIPDRQTPTSRTTFEDLVWAVQACVSTGATVVVHCRQGIGRAGMVAVGVLATTGVELTDAIDRVSAARGRPVPETPAQRQWLIESGN